MMTVTDSKWHELQIAELQAEVDILRLKIYGYRRAGEALRDENAALKRRLARATRALEIRLGW